MRAMKRRQILLATLSLTACAQFKSQFTPGALDWDSKPLAFRYGAQSENNASSIATSTAMRLRASRAPLLELLAALESSKQRVVLEVDVHDYDLGGTTFDGTSFVRSSMMVPGLSLVLRYAKEGEDVTPGEPRKERGFHVEGAPEGLPPKVVDDGQNAIFAIPYELNGLNTIGALVRKDVFEALVVRKRLEMGQKADYRIPDRPAEKSLADIEAGLAIAATVDEAINRWRASMVLLMSQVGAPRAVANTEAIGKTIDDLLADIDGWLREHPMVMSIQQMEDKMKRYGMTPKPLMLPTPQNMLLLLDEDGYIAAAVKVANGIATGSIADTVQGISGFAPKDSSARTTMEALAAGARGDVAGCADALAKLGGKDAKIAEISEQVSQLKRVR